jgi:hydrogenase nickel incorporation protein HypA/HybF
MHELSIVMSIVDIASSQLQKVNASEIEEIELEIGTLSGVELNSFDFAWRQAVKQTPLDKAVRKINLIEGRGRCLDCNIEFSIQNLYDACPICNGHLIDILKGKELRVKSLIVN